MCLFVWNNGLDVWQPLGTFGVGLISREIRARLEMETFCPILQSLGDCEGLEVNGAPVLSSIPYNKTSINPRKDRMQRTSLEMKTWMLLIRGMLEVQGSSAHFCQSSHLALFSTLILLIKD